MTRRRRKGLFNALRAVASPTFWFWSVPNDPKTSAQLVLLAILTFLADIGLIPIPESGRGE